MNNLPPVTTREEHAAAMARLEELMIKDPPEGSAEDAELEALATAIEAFEKRVCFKD
jgi:hypothetical protein